MTNYIFDLYGTLIDIHTSESKASLWKEVALLFSMNGVPYAETELRKSYLRLCKVEEGRQWDRQKKMRDGSLLKREIELPLDRVFTGLFTEKGIEPSKEKLKLMATAFRALSTYYIRLYDGAEDLLKRLKRSGKKIYLLSNAQRIFTEPEMKMLGIYELFDGILYSSDAGVKKPSHYFFEDLFEKYGLKKEDSVMIGNEYEADILGADAFGITSMYVHTSQSGKKRPEKLPDGCMEIAVIGEVF